MRQQLIKGRALPVARGFLAILGAVLALYAINLGSQALAIKTGIGVFSLGGWLCTIAVVVFILYRYCAGYRYTLSDGVLVFERVFGNQGRVLLTLTVQDVLALRDVLPEDADARIDRLTASVCPLPHRVLVYRKNGAQRLLELQMDADFEQALREVMDAAQTLTPAE